MINFLQGRKILAVLRNYRAHAQELGNAVPTKPIFFLKPTTSYVSPGSPIQLPTGATVHHEVELGVVISKSGRFIPEETAAGYIGGYVLAFDLTARNIQDAAKEQRLPWTEAKGYDTFCPVSRLISPNELPDLSAAEIWCQVNGVDKQRSPLSNMIFKVPQLISHASQVMTLEAGDVILTGTPSGVGPIVPGDVLEGGLTGVLSMKFDVEEAQAPPH